MQMNQPVASKTILGIEVNTTSYEDSCDRIQTWAQNGTSCYVVAANVHVIMMAQWQRAYRQVLRQAALVTPDGMPLVIGLRLLGATAQPRVYGPDLMLAWCERAAATGLPIYLYGGSEVQLEKLVDFLSHRFPNLLIAGTYSPPYRPLTAAEVRADGDRIARSGAKVVFVGLGCPKQEQWMAHQQGFLSAVMIGVGAAFSFFSGEVAQAPRWMMASGLEWLYRLSREPRRLWRRYLINNPVFLGLFMAQLTRYHLCLALNRGKK
ncbi:glycosyltransferase [filamentous cyanobacterium CCP5]|nr:glycosyltransferase [filamentous cyanobacterium CCP5]